MKEVEDEDKAEVAETQYELTQNAQKQVAVDDFSNDPLTMEEQEDSESANEEQDEFETGPVNDFAGDAADKYLETMAKYDQDEAKANRFKHAPPLTQGMTPKVLQ